MKAVQVHELGAPEVLRYDEAPVPRPGVGEALVKIEAAGINYLDLYYRSGFLWGSHQPRTLPFTPGAEAAGTVVEIGPAVSEVKDGERVAYGISNGQGSYAEFASVSASQLVQLPASISFQTGAALMLQGMTAHYLTQSAYPIKSTDAVLIHAAAGGTGLLLVQMAKMRGARVIGTVSSSEKARLAEQAGADCVINYVVEDFEEETKRFTRGRRVNVVYDSVGKATFEKSLNCLAPRGTLIIFGQSSGPVPPFDTAILNAKGSLCLMRPSLTHYVTNRAELLFRAGDLFHWVEAGKLKVRIGRTYALSDAAQAHRDLAMRSTTGKLLLIP